MSAPACEFIIAWPSGSKPAVYCGTLATQRYPAMGGGFMHMCDEHSITHLNHTEPIPMPDSPEPIMQFFAWAHLPAHLQEVSRPFGEQAATIVATLPRNPERTVALRKLLESKDAAVRAKLYKQEATS
jgi:hypothetical protein